MFSPKPILAAVAFALFAVPALAHAQATDVIITNAPEDPGPVVNPADTFPLVATQQVSAFSGNSGVASFGNIVPSGYRLIIDHVSLFGRTPAGQRLWGVVHPCDNLKGSPWGTVGIATVANVEDSNLVNYIHFGSADTSLYADAGCLPTVSLQRNASNGGFGAWVTLQGHLVPTTARASGQ